MEKSPEGEQAMNLEWQHMFGSSDGGASSRTMIHSENTILPPEPDHSLHDKSYVECMNCILF